MAEKAKLETLKQRAELILQFERVMSKAERENPQYHPKYLHALVAADEVEDELGAEEAGVINGVKRLLMGKNSLGDKVEEMQKALETKMQMQKAISHEMQTAIRANDQKVEKIEEKVEKIEEKVDGLKGDMAKVMAMLEAMQRN